MAIPAAQAQRRGVAIDHLQSTMKAIGDKYDLAPMAAGVHNIRTSTNPHIAQMLEIEAFDAWATALAEKLGVALPEPEPVPDPPLPFDGMSIAALRIYATERGVPFTERTPEAELLKGLRAQLPQPPVVEAEPDEATEGPEKDEVDDDADDYDDMTVSELKILANERGIDLGDATKKADIISVLETADTEDFVS